MYRIAPYPCRDVPNVWGGWLHELDTELSDIARLPILWIPQQQASNVEILPYHDIIIFYM